MVVRSNGGGRYASGALDELDYQAWFAESFITNISSPALQEAAEAEIHRLEQEEHRELRRAESLLQRFNEVVNSLDQLPEVVLEGSLGVLSNLIVVKVSLPSRYVRYFVRSKQVCNDIVENGFHEVAEDLLAELSEVVPRNYIEICGNGYTQLNSYYSIDLYSEPKYYGNPPWPMILPAIQQNYRNYCLRVCATSGGRWEVVNFSTGSRASEEWNPSESAASTTAAAIGGGGSSNSVSQWIPASAEPRVDSPVATTTYGRQRAPSYATYTRPPCPKRRFSLLPQDEVFVYGTKRRYSVNEPTNNGSRRRSSVMAG